MKLYAQHGAQNGEKLNDGFKDKLIDGVIFSPRDIALEKLKTSLQEIKEIAPSADLLFDPQYYTCLLAYAENVRLGYLSEDYQGYFSARRRLQLTKENLIKDDIRQVLKFQSDLPVTHFIAPNVLIPHSFDSRETAICIDFLNKSDECYHDLKDSRPLFITLAISRDALLNQKLLMEFVDEITSLNLAAKGFYLLISANSIEARTEIFHQDVISGWMYLNHTLQLNGYEVINSYSDMLSPALAAAGGTAGATGWWSNLRTFSLDRFGEGTGGGRLPKPRYLSIALMNRITFYELDVLRKLDTTKLWILNNLPKDVLYNPERGSEPPRNKEVLQSWESLKQMISSIGNVNQLSKLNKCLKMVDDALENYTKIDVGLESKSNDDHLLAIKEGILGFKRIAEIESSAK